MDLMINDGGLCMPRVVIESSQYHYFVAFCYSGWSKTYGESFHELYPDPVALA